VGSNSGGGEEGGSRLFYRNQFVGNGGNRPMLDGVTFNMLSESQKLGLEEIFTGEEIEAVVKECDGNKSPSPDGFNFAFIKRFWYLLKDEVRIMFDQFYANEVIPRSLLMSKTASVRFCRSSKKRVSFQQGVV